MYVYMSMSLLVSVNDAAADQVPSTSADAVK